MQIASLLIRSAVCAGIVWQSLLPTQLAFAQGAELRISRPSVAYFTKPPLQLALNWAVEPVFCGVLLCHGTCQHREGPCKLRTFEHLLAQQSDCCATPAAETAKDSCAQESAQESVQQSADCCAEH